jgi:hypothetical protein
MEKLNVRGIYFYRPLACLAHQMDRGAGRHDCAPEVGWEAQKWFIRIPTGPKANYRRGVDRNSKSDNLLKRFI